MYMKKSRLFEEKGISDSVNNISRASLAEINNPNMSVISGRESGIHNISMHRDDDILSNIINFVSTHIPNLKIDKYYSTDQPIS